MRHAARSENSEKLMDQSQLSSTIRKERREVRKVAPAQYRCFLSVSIRAAIMPIKLNPCLWSLWRSHWRWPVFFPLLYQCKNDWMLIRATCKKPREVKRTAVFLGLNLFPALGEEKLPVLVLCPQPRGMQRSICNARIWVYQILGFVFFT